MSIRLLVVKAGFVLPMLPEDRIVDQNTHTAGYHQQNHCTLVSFNRASDLPYLFIFNFVSF